ncbi:hypothetical protein CYY_005664 [Polysphondylium violaceum]|uniref:Uncharacterized protein n=1 Tax=Polysphondylium violaceum TaxID=133409 RepID=A0A8J4UZH0_9MYCE|nr:hypothetical protein CYY_005664 [Polysphondylium violaceum]
MSEPDLTVIEKFCPLAAEKLAFPAKEEYLRKADFEKKMKKLITDMENKMDKKIDDEIVKFCEAKFASLCSVGAEFAETQSIYDEEKKESKPTSESVKRYMAAYHAAFKSLLLECLIFFSREDKIDLLCKLYLQTVVMYIAFLRDTHFHGIDWGLPEKTVNGVDHIKSFAYKTNKTIELAYSYYNLQVMKGNVRKEESRISVNSVIDTRGITTIASNVLFFKCFYFTEPKNLTFRPTLIQMLKLKMVIREIPEGKHAENPDTSRNVATKSHSENFAYK